MRRWSSILILVFFVSSLLWSVSRDSGLTSNIPVVTNDNVVGSAQSFSGIKKRPESTESRTEFVRDEWVLVDSLNFSNYLAASDNFAIEYNGMNNTINLIDDSLTNLASQALDYAPLWMHERLATTLMSMDPDNQDLWADVILQANHPYVDEIAFSIAYSSKTYLEADYATAELFQQNAWLIYEHDMDLSYVEVVDYG